MLGGTGRNFAAGMSGGIAYVLDEQGDFGRHCCNMEMVELETLEDADDIAELQELIENHQCYTGSAVAQRLLDNWDASLSKFVKIIPSDFKAALERLSEEEIEAESAVTT